MKYELAKKLKDAGFPQKEWKKESDNFLARENGDSKEGEYDDFNDRTMRLKYFSDNYLKEMDERGLIVYLPTLSELIEACGNNFFNLQRHSEGKYIGNLEHEEPNGHQWVCNFSGNNVNSCEDEWESEGSTPEEAVADLWLLNETKNN